MLLALAAWSLVALACLSPVRGGGLAGITPQQANLGYALAVLLAAGLVAAAGLSGRRLPGARPRTQVGAQRHPQLAARG